MRRVTVIEQPGQLVVCRLAPDAPIPVWADGPGFVTISRSEDELSIVCAPERVPDGIKVSDPWVRFQFQGPFAFSETGILAAVLTPLASARIGIFAISTFDTDHLLVAEPDRAATIASLRQSGHEVITLG
jgi:hypothetical protein